MLGLEEQHIMLINLDLKNKFLEDCYELTNKNMKEILFKNNIEKFMSFFELLLRLIKFNISDRINIIDHI